MLALSAFMSWYAGSGDGLTIAVIGWHTGVLGKLVFLLGLGVVALGVLRELGIELPPTIPESLVVIVFGSLATILVLIRLIAVPDRFFPYDGRGIGIWIALAASLALIVGGLLQRRRAVAPASGRDSRKVLRTFRDEIHSGLSCRRR